VGGWEELVEALRPKLSAEAFTQLLAATLLAGSTAEQAAAIGELLTDACSARPAAVESADSSSRDQLAALCAAVTKDVGSEVHVRTLHALIEAIPTSEPGKASEDTDAAVEADKSLVELLRHLLGRRAATTSAATAEKRLRLLPLALPPDAQAHAARTLLWHLGAEGQRTLVDDVVLGSAGSADQQAEMLLRLWQRVPLGSASRAMGSMASTGPRDAQSASTASACAPAAAASSKNVQLLALQHALDTGALSPALYVEAKEALGK
jgi:hypothetical protein